MGIFDATSIPSSPTGQTTSTSGISSWAQPYISDYLTKAQGLIANQQTPGLLNQSYVDAGNLQLPGGFASGTALAEAGGKGSLSTAPIALQYGQQGAQYGYQAPKYGETGAAMGTAASRAGDMYASQATSPEAMARYMSPYMQNVTDWEKQQAVRDYQIQAPQMAAAAVGQGAFGGNRLALQQAEANRGLQNRLSGIDVTGREKAFQQAQQAQQFGANLGLQGLQTGMQGQQVGIQGLQAAMQGAQTGLQGVSGAQQGYAGATQAGGTLGNIAAQEAQARLAALQLKNQFGLQQQQWPYQQLQFQQGMMSGLPIGTTTQQVYQSPPNPWSQGIGLAGALGTGYLAYKAMTGATGGLPEDFKEAKGYAEGGDVSAPNLPSGPAGFGQFEMDQINAINRQQAPMAAGLGGAGISALMPAQNPDNSAYLNSLYKNMFGREADQGGFQHNLDLLNSGKIDQQGLADAFANSAEGQTSPYRPRLMPIGLNPTSGGLAELGLARALKG